MNRLVAAIVGFVVAAIVPIVATVAATIMTRGWYSSLVPEALLAYQGSLVVTGVFGLPAFLLFWRYGLIRWWSTMAVGAVIGALVTVTMGINVYGDMAGDVLFFSLTGAASALAFWLIWRLGRGESKRGQSGYISN